MTSTSRSLVWGAGLLGAAGMAVLVPSLSPTLRARIALVRHGVPLSDDITAVHTASRADDAETLGRLRDAGADLQARDAHGRTPLQSAAAAGAAGAAEFLVAQGASADGPGDGPAPLSTALEARDLDVARVLLQNGATPEVPVGPDRIPALLHVVRTGDAEALRLLLEFRADPNVAAAGGPSALALAIARDDATATNALLRAGADPNVADASGQERSLLELTIRQERPTLAADLIAHGADPNAQSREGQPLVVLAVALGRADLVGTLLDAGVDVDTRLAPGVSEEFLALVPGKYARYYLTRDEGLTPLMVAVLRSDLDLTRLLLNRKASLGPTKKLVKYPLGMAADRDNVPLMQVLLGRDPVEAARTRRIVVSLRDQRAILYENEAPTFHTRVSTGRPGFRTPGGDYVITDKRRRWRSTIYDAEMPYFMRLSGSDIGLHQGIVPTRPASHGCVRLPAAAAKTLFLRMRVGDPVTITP